MFCRWRDVIFRKNIQSSLRFILIYFSTLIQKACIPHLTPLPWITLDFIFYNTLWQFQLISKIFLLSRKNLDQHGSSVLGAWSHIGSVRFIKAEVKVNVYIRSMWWPLMVCEMMEDILPVHRILTLTNFCPQSVRQVNNLLPWWGISGSARLWHENIFSWVFIEFIFLNILEWPPFFLILLEWYIFIESN